MKMCGTFGDADRDRDAYYRGRYRELVELLSKEDHEKFREINRIRKMYLDTFRDAETKPTRCVWGNPRWLQVLLPALAR